MKTLFRISILLMISICLFGANVMNVESTSVNTNEVFWVEISIDNDDAFVAFECDLYYPEGFTYMDEAVLSDRKGDHTLSAQGNTGYVLLFSFTLTNAEFTGSSGTVVSAKFQAGSSSGDYTFSLADVTIGNAASENICTGYNSGTITVTEVPLPIELQEFNAVETSNGVKLTWTTATETENNYFILYRNDQVIVQVPGAGTSSEPHNYEFLDKTAYSGMHTYILSDLNYAGIEDKHTRQAIEIEIGNDHNFPANFILHDVYPNPFNPSAMISYELPTAGLMDLSVFDLHGEKICTLYSGFQYSGYYKIPWHADHNPGGIYLLRLRTGQGLLTQKMLLIK